MNDFFTSPSYLSANQRARKDLSMPEVKAKDQELLIRVLVYEIDQENPVRDRVVDFNDHNMRHWLTNTTVWAMLNHKTIEIVNIKDDK